MVISGIQKGRNKRNSGVFSRVKIKMTLQRNGLHRLSGIRLHQFCTHVEKKKEETKKARKERNGKEQRMRSRALQKKSSDTILTFLEPVDMTLLNSICMTLMISM